MLDGIPQEIHIRAQAQLVLDIGLVGTDGLGTELERLRHLGSVLTLGEHLQHVVFPIAKRLVRLFRGP